MVLDGNMGLIKNDNSGVQFGDSKIDWSEFSDLVKEHLKMVPDTVSLENLGSRFALAAL